MPEVFDTVELRIPLFDSLVSIVFLLHQVGKLMQMRAFLLLLHHAGKLVQSQGSFVFLLHQIPRRLPLPGYTR